MTSLGEDRDEAWKELGERSRLLRFLVGRERADRLVRIARDCFPTEELAACEPGSEEERKLIEETEIRVSRLYSERCGVAFQTLVLAWAISSIVQILVLRWWRGRRQTGWSP